MKLMKKILAAMLAVIIVAGTFMPAPAQAASRITNGVKFAGWANNAETSCWFRVQRQGITSFQYRIFYNSGRLKKTGTSSVYTNSAQTQQICKVEGLTSQACSFVSIRAKKNGAWTAWSSKYCLVPLFRSDWITITTNKYTQTTKLSWRKITGTSQYDVYLSTSSDGGWQKVKTTTTGGVTLTTFGGRKFRSGQTYYFKIIAKKYYNGSWITSAGNTRSMRNGYFWYIY